MQKHKAMAYEGQKNDTEELTTLLYVQIAMTK